jgi:hypothetical protein
MGLFVVAMSPCVKVCSTADTEVPMPALSVPAPDSDEAYMAANSARPDLAPTVFTLATLLPITSRFLAAAFSPESPCWKLICDAPGRSGYSLR